jgi:hypothetical protein
MMKVSTIITQALALALPFVGETNANSPPEGAAAIEERQNNCALNAIWDSNWREGGYQQYRVRAWADTGDRYEEAIEMLDEY